MLLSQTWKQQSAGFTNLTIKLRNISCNIQFYLKHHGSRKRQLLKKWVQTRNALLDGGGFHNNAQLLHSCLVGGRPRRRRKWAASGTPACGTAGTASCGRTARMPRCTPCGRRGCSSTAPAAIEQRGEAQRGVEGRHKGAQNPGAINSNGPNPPSIVWICGKIIKWDQLS